SASSGTRGPEAPAKTPATKTAGYVLVGVGAVGLGVGLVTGAMAISKNKSSTDACPNDGACADRDAVDASSSAKSLGTVSTVGFLVGGAALATGLVLVLITPGSGSKRAGSLRLAPAVGANQAGLAAWGAF